MRHLPSALILLLALVTGGQARAASAPTSGHAMVVAANPLAAEAGMKVLKAGGGAVDAAVAIQSVLGLVEPQSSGLGGGAFMTYYDAKSGKVVAYNGRETAPAADGPDLFLTADGKFMGFMTAVDSGRSTGVPGVVAMLALAQKEHGRLPWKGLFDSARTLSTDGFIVSPRLSGFIHSAIPTAKQPDVVAYFSQGGAQEVKTGDRLKNPAYAAFLTRLAAEGPKAFYEGPTAKAIVARLHADPIPGALTEADLAGYKPKETAAFCRPHRDYLVCVPPPPSSGVALLQALALLDHTDIATRGPKDPKAWVQFIEASRLMYADRDRYFGDTDFTSVPLEGMLDPAYVAERAKLFADKVGAPPSAGRPPGAPDLGPDATAEPGGTSHFVVVDDQGNVVSMTTSVESVFGSGHIVEGMVLNNQLTDFSQQPKGQTGAANAPAGGKRPRSSMSPVIVLDKQGRFYAALGSPGGNAILAYNLKMLVAMLDWNMPVDAAVKLPNVIARGAPIGAETDRFDPETVKAITGLGANLRSGGAEGSGFHAVVVKDGKLAGAADPRREGVVLGY